MSGVTLEEIQRQEDEIFSDNMRVRTATTANVNWQPARIKALQQLALSEDSPFNFESEDRKHPQFTVPQRQILDPTDGLNEVEVEDEETRRLHDEKARLLREETDRIKEQIDFVRSQLNELNNNQCSEAHPRQPHCNHDHLQSALETGDNPEQPTRLMSHGEKRHEFVNNQQMTSTDSQFNRNFTNKNGEWRGTRSDATNLKLRPLTGKTDCPNCDCDRRSSVCDKCIGFQRAQADQERTTTTKEKIIRQPTFITEQQISTLISGDQQQQHQQAPTTTGTRKNFLSQRDYDERPVRPAQERPVDLAPVKAPQVTEAQTVEHVVVPGKLYTIGKSLNDKRTKLAQAIEDLQLMMDKVRKRGDRLDQERKVAQLYKGQWKFGPSIGARSYSSSSLAGASRHGSRESLRGSGQYQSRFDPNLARDSKSMMGFQHVGPSMRNLRQNGATRPSGQAPQPPRPRPRLSKQGGARLANASNLHMRPTTASILHARSKSMEALHSQTANRTARQRQQQATARDRVAPKPAPRTSLERKTNPVASKNNNNERFQSGRSSSEINLTSDQANRQRSAGSSSPGDSSSAAVEEDLEQDEIREDEEINRSPQPRPRSRSSSREEARNEARSSRSPLVNEASDRRDEEKGEPKLSDEREQQAPELEKNKKAWIPVFGETEIKTINRQPPQRKVLVLDTPKSGTTAQIVSTNKSILRQTSQRSAMRTRSTSNDRVLDEATKKLQFASDLLESEHRDSRTTNQLVVNRTRPAAPARRKPAVPTHRIARNNTQPKTIRAGGVSADAAAGAGKQDGSTSRPKAPTTQAAAENLIFGANKEISRLEEMISEQQALLLKLTQSNAVPTPLSPCCHHHSTPCRPRASVSPISQTRHAHRQLISNLRERLNKTKARLARTLEEERAKHQQLEQKVDSSLRKQSDLENENELLKRSLSKCIDTCLQDISSTFESLSDTLNESMEVSTEAPNTDDAQQAFKQKLESLQIENSGAGGEAGSVSPMLSNAAQLIADNRHLKRMKSHIEAIERQRRGIFEELNQEKNRSQQLEAELRRSKLELEQLVEAKRRLEAQLEGTNLESAATKPAHDVVEAQQKQQQQQALEPRASTSKQVNFEDLPPASSPPATQGVNHPAAPAKPINNGPPQQQQPISESNSLSLAASSIDDGTSMTYNSIDTYRQYIQSMTPDLDAIRRERRMILDEFDNIKKVLSDMDSS